jgi:hypothetical protein
MSDTQCTLQGQPVVAAHDLKPLATPERDLLGHFTARRPAWDAQLRFAAGHAIVTAASGCRRCNIGGGHRRAGPRSAPVVAVYRAGLSRSGIEGGAEAGQSGLSAVSELDLKKLALVLGKCGGAHGGEAVSATRAFRRVPWQNGRGSNHDVAA